MKSHNVKEYELIRKEIEELKKCINQYISYLFGGSGIALCTIFLNNSYSPLIISIISIIVAILVMSLNYLLLYKYISHNRYAGYLRLISQELKHSKLENSEFSNEDIKELYLWELCVSQLSLFKSCSSVEKINQKFDKVKFKLSDAHFKDESEKLDYINKNINDYLTNPPQIDNKSFKKGVNELIQQAIGNRTSSSWGFPLYTSFIVYIIALFFSSGSIIFFLKYLKIENICNISIFLSREESYLFIILLLIFSLFVYRSIKKLAKIMLGSNTVIAFCWSFLYFRVYFLNDLGIYPTYIHAEGKMDWGKN